MGEKLTAAPPMTDIRTLLERVEKATGPSRELDGLIAKHFGEMSADARWMVTDVYGESSDTWYTGGYGNYTFHHPEEYTASIDAALALVERMFPGAPYSYSRQPLGDQTRWTVHIHPPGSPTGTGGSFDNGPIAIILALLAALRSLANGERDG